MNAPRVKVLPLKRSFTILLEKLSHICLLFMTATVPVELFQNLLQFRENSLVILLKAISF